MPQPLDLLLRNVVTPVHGNPVDLGIRDGKIATITPAETEAGTPASGGTAPAEVIDGGGRLVSAPFVDAHFHLDSVRTRVPNQTGTLREGIDNWGRYKAQTLSVEEIVERAGVYCRHAFSQGIQAIRSHVDVSDPQLRTVEGLVEVRRQFKELIDIQLVAFPQDGFYGDPETRQRLLRALDMGVDVVGGIPHNEPRYDLGTQSLAELLEIAADRGLRVDIHCDESDDPQSRHVETLAAETVRLGLQGRVTASHITASATYDSYYLHRRLLPLMHRAELSVVVNPLINVHLGGHYSHPAHRAMAPVKELIAAGLRVAAAQDCNEDPWYPLGNADMFEVAKMAGHIAHLMGEGDFAVLFSMITEAPAAIMGFEDYGISEGAPANLVLFEATGIKEALRTSARRVAVIRRGVVRAP
ncbi:MAG: cytosine deaminase [Spirochaetota bacterium]